MAGGPANFLAAPAPDFSQAAPVHSPGIFFSSGSGSVYKGPKNRLLLLTIGKVQQNNLFPANVFFLQSAPAPRYQKKPGSDRLWLRLRLLLPSPALYLYFFTLIPFTFLPVCSNLVRFFRSFILELFRPRIADSNFFIDNASLTGSKYIKKMYKMIYTRAGRQNQASIC